MRVRPPTQALRHGPDSYGRQQSRILVNGGNPEPATPRARRSPSGCKELLREKNPSPLYADFHIFDGFNIKFILRN